MHVALPGCTKAECCFIEVVVDAYGERDLRPADRTALVVSVPAVARRRAYLGLVTARSSPRATTSHARSGETSRESRREPPGVAGSHRVQPHRAPNGARPSSGGLSRHHAHALPSEARVPRARARLIPG